MNFKLVLWDFILNGYENSFLTTDMNINPFFPKISLAILLTIYRSILIVIVWIIWYEIS